MNQANAYNAYKNNEVMTASRTKLVVMLYDGAITFLEQAKEEIQAKHYDKKGILISQALDIIAELDSSINAEKAGR